MKPLRIVGGSPVFLAGDEEFLLSSHAIEQAAARGMKIQDLLDVLAAPVKVCTPTADSFYYGDPTMRYVKDPWAVVVDYQAPIKIVVTVRKLNGSLRRLGSWWSSSRDLRTRSPLTICTLRGCRKNRMGTC